MVETNRIRNGRDPRGEWAARMYDYHLGGKDNYEADRTAAEASLEAAPELRSIARENRAFQGGDVGRSSSAGVLRLAAEGWAIVGGHR